MSGKAYKAMMEFSLKGTSNSAFQKKINTLASEAFMECQDERASLAYQRSVPVFKR